MPKLEFWSDNRHYGLVLPASQVERLIGFCLAVQGQETGGILVGQYNAAHDCATVTVVSEAPSDSQAGRTWFHRGMAGLSRWLRQLWTKREYYLGEWHYHPNGRPLPSGTDAAQMREIATSIQYHCPEPLMIIIGEDQEFGFRLLAYVFPKGAGPIPLE